MYATRMYVNVITNITFSAIMVCVVAFITMMSDWEGVVQNFVLLEEDKSNRQRIDKIFKIPNGVNHALFESSTKKL